MTNNTSLTIISTAIRQDVEGRFSLSDCWAASGKAKAHQPSEWFAAQKTKAFLSVLDGDRESPVTSVSSVMTGANADRGYWAVREAVIHYATWISPEFYLTVIRAFDAMVQGVLREDRKTKRIAAPSSEEIMANALQPVTVRLDAQGARLIALAERLETALTAYDPSAGFSTDYRPMRFFVENAGVLRKGRGGLIRNMSRRCVKWMLRNDLGGSIRHSRDQERHLFHVDTVPRWMQIEGAAMIRAHMDKMTGQGTLAPKRKKGRMELSPRPFPHPKEAAS